MKAESDKAFWIVDVAFLAYSLYFMHYDAPTQYTNVMCHVAPIKHSNLHYELQAERYVKTLVLEIQLLFDLKDISQTGITVSYNRSVK